jgi:hypothetical protein
LSKTWRRNQNYFDKTISPTNLRASSIISEIWDKSKISETTFKQQIYSSIVGWTNIIRTFYSCNHFFTLGNELNVGGFFFLGFLFSIIPLIYNSIKDGLGQGQSWGKKKLDLMVVNLDNNTPCDKKKSFFRNFISGLVFIIPFVGWLIESIMVLVTEDGRKLGDKAANTQVIDKRNFYN